MANPLPQESQSAGPSQSRKSLAKKSQGAYPIGQEPHPSGTGETTFIDHANNAGISIYWGRSPRRGAPILPPLWSYQVYVTYGPTASSAPDLPSKFFNGVWESMIMSYVHPFRLDFNFLSGADLEACKVHYRHEKAAREQANTSLKFISKWDDEGYDNMFILMDSPNWADEGVSFVSFDLQPECQDPASDCYTSVETHIEPGLKVFKTEPGPACPPTHVSGRMLDAEAGIMTIFVECKRYYNEAIEAGKSSWSQAIAERHI